MVANSSSDNELLLKQLGICPQTLADNYSSQEIDKYIGIVNWLTRRKLKPGSSALERTKGYKEALHLLCQLQEWEKIQVILHESLSINSTISLPLYEYLLFNELSRELLAICEEIITVLEGCEHDFTFIELLKARAMSATNNQREEARLLLEQLFNKSLSGTEIHVESLAYLGMRQVHSGLYQEGIENLNSVLLKIDQGDFASSIKIKQLKTDILENLAFYEMNASHFEDAMRLYNDVIFLRENLGLFHKTISPLAHQGIISRKIRNYDQAKFFLEKAKNRAIEIENESQVIWVSHHLAYVFLNQGNRDLAEELCQFSIKGCQKFDSQWGLSDCYEQMGLIALAQKKIEIAQNCFELSLNIRRMIDNRHGTASSTMDLALVFWNQGKFLKSIFYLLKAFNLYYKLGILNRARFLNMLKLALVWNFGNKKWTM
jgi:tetratricopeptide (TPR) repeat protein